MRTSMVGALLGARVGLSGIPSRFIDGLEDSDYLISLAQKIADAALERNDESDEWYWPTEMEMDVTIGAADSQESDVPVIADSASNEEDDSDADDAEVQPSAGAFTLVLAGVFLGILIAKLSPSSPARTNYDSGGEDVPTGDGSLGGGASYGSIGGGS